MSRVKYTVKAVAELNGEPFPTAEEAWLWYSRCQMARLQGARPVAGLGGEVRPCDPDDIARAVNGLYRHRVLGRHHLGVLGRFGVRQSAPDPWAGDTPSEATLWTEALDRLSTVLKGKGIVQ